MFYQDILNNKYINQQNYQTLQQQKFDFQQQKEIVNMVKAIEDFCKAAKKLDPQYRDEALKACIVKFGEELYGNC